MRNEILRHSVTGQGAAAQGWQPEWQQWELGQGWQQEKWEWVQEQQQRAYYMALLPLSPLFIYSFLVVFIISLYFKYFGEKQTGFV